MERPIRGTGLALVLWLAGAWPAMAQAPCPPPGFDKPALLQLAQREFAIDDDATRTRLAQGLLACLGDADPGLRDEVAFSAYSAWMRNKQLDTATLRSLRDSLYGLLKQEDGQGFRRPFAALVLSEIARTDRIEPWMSTEERDAMVMEAAAYLKSVQDYRGYDPVEGWRHGVAHGSDWLLQLAMNPALQRAQLQAILEAVSSQVAPAAGHAYVFGEPERLARPVLYVAQRGLLSEAEWNAWFDALAASLGGSPQRYKDSGWLARRHDLQAFLDAVYVNADQSADPHIHALKTSAAAAMRRF